VANLKEWLFKQEMIPGTSAITALIIFSIPIVIILGIFTCWLVKRRNTSPLAYKIFTAAKKAIFWSLIIRVVLTTYINFCVSANFGSILVYDGFKPNLPLIIYLSLVIYVSYTFLKYSNSQELEMSDYRQKYGSLY